jgi:hypothetical protein
LSTNNSVKIQEIPKKRICADEISINKNELVESEKRETLDHKNDTKELLEELNLWKAKFFVLEEEHELLRAQFNDVLDVNLRWQKKD